MTKKELLAIPMREKWNTPVEGVDGVYIIPTAKKHESGYSCIRLVAYWNDSEAGERKYIGCGYYCDVIELKGLGFRIDASLPNRIVHIFNFKKFSITEEISSLSLVETGFSRWSGLNQIEASK